MSVFATSYYSLMDFEIIFEDEQECEIRKLCSISGLCNNKMKLFMKRQK